MIAPDRESSPRDLRWAGSIAWSVLGILILAAVGVYILYLIRAIFPPLVLALLVIFMLNPVVSRLERRGVRRLWGTLLVYVLFTLIVILLVALIIPPLGRQVAELNANVPRLRNEILSFTENTADRLGITFDASQISQRIADAQDQLLSELGRVVEFTLSAIHLILIFVLAPIIALYLLIDLPKLQRSFIKHLPPAYRDEILVLLEKTGAAVGGFFRGQLLVALIVGTMSAIGLALINIPFWLPIGLLVGFFNIIPFVGPFIGGGIAVIIGAASGGFTQAALAAGVMVVVQQIDNHLISPNVMGRAVRLHPVTIILALLAGGTIAGLWGMLLSVPGTAVGKIWFLHFYGRHVLEEGPLDEEKPAEEPTPGEDETESVEPVAPEIALVSPPVLTAAPPGENSRLSGTRGRKKSRSV